TPHSMRPSRALWLWHGTILPHAVQPDEHVFPVPDPRAHVRLLANNRRLQALARPDECDSLRRRPMHQVRRSITNRRPSHLGAFWQPDPRRNLLPGDVIKLAEVIQPRHLKLFV